MIVYLEQLGLKIAYRIAKVLAGTKITAVQVTVSRFIISAPLSAYFFSRGEYLSNIIGLAFYIPLALMDWVDGDLANLKGEASDLRRWLDDTLDRVLVLIVLGSIFYAGTDSPNGQIWTILAILFFSVFFLLTTLLSDFDQRFNLKFHQYSEVTKKMYQLDRKPKLVDRLLVNFLNVHRNSITRFCFCISYPLFVGIVINQLLPTFSFITFMFSLRALGLCFIIYRVVRRGETDSALTAVLREYWSKK